MKLVAVFAASLLSVTALAQSTTVETETVTAGLLGKRYLGTSFGWVDRNHSQVENLGAGLDLNLPVHTNIDLSLNYGYSWLEGATEVGHVLNAAVTGYITRGENKPYLTLSTGYVWANRNFDRDHGVWGAEAGIERAVNDKISSTFSVGYDDDFRNHGEGLWDVAIGATYNFTDKLVGTAEVSYIEYGSVGYNVGLVFRF